MDVHSDILSLRSGGSFFGSLHMFSLQPKKKGFKDEGYEPPLEGYEPPLLLLFVFVGCFFYGFYHGKSPENHHLGNICHFVCFNHPTSKSKSSSSDLIINPPFSWGNLRWVPCFPPRNSTTWQSRTGLLPLKPQRFPPFGLACTVWEMVYSLKVLNS